MLGFCSDSTIQFINMLCHWMRYKLLVVLTKINTIPCLCTTALGQRVDDWLQYLAYIERITDAYSQ